MTRERKMMKIGILTYHKSVNYGSVLQAWALQELLRTKGYEVEIIDYEPESYGGQYGIFLSNSSLENVCKNALRIPVRKYKNHQIQLFAEFRSKELALSKEKYNKHSDLSILGAMYDCIICGSDQIWNVHAKDCDDAFFLPCVNTKKIAYAVSINNTNFTEDRCDNEMRRWICDFDLITCREESGANRIRKFIKEEQPVFTVLDPTLLHDKQDFDLIVSPRIIPHEYVFLYKVWSGVDSFRMVVSLGKRLSLPVYTLLLVRNIIALIRIEKQGIKVVKDRTGPEDFLSLIKYASYVMTDSFHGTAFSVIFEKPVICVKEKRLDGTEKKDERIINILQQLGIRDRYVPITEFDTFNIDRQLDYCNITRQRMRIAKKDISRLINSIEA